MRKDHRMSRITQRRRTFLRHCVGIGALSIQGEFGGAGPTTEPTPGALGPTAPAATSCTPGHTDGDPACRQLRNDKDVLTGFPAADTELTTRFSYPCGWVTTVSREDDRIQANVTRSEIGPENAYVDVQVRNYDSPVEEGHLETIRAEGDYDVVDYQYDGETRTGLVSSHETARFGTTAHAVVPSPVDASLVHVEFVSTLKAGDCPQPQPDYQLVRAMLQSLEPNFGHVDAPTASVTIADQSVSAEVQTQAVVVERVSLSEGGYVSISTRTGSIGIDTIIGASSYLGAGEHRNVRIALAEAIETEQAVAAAVHLDTDGDNVYEFGSSPGVDDPYVAGGGGPVQDQATISPVADTTIADDTSTVPPTTFPPTTTTIPLTTFPPTEPPTATPTTVRTSTPASQTSTEGSGPGFGLGAALGALGLGALVVGYRRVLNRSE